MEDELKPLYGSARHGEILLTNRERHLDRQLQTFGARVLEHAFDDGIIPGEYVDTMYTLLEDLRRTQIEEMRGVLYD